MILIVDTEYKGHHSEYLDIIINSFIENKREGIFLVHPAYLNNRNYLYESRFLKFHKWEPNNSLKHLINEMRFIKHIIKKQNATKCILLNFNRYFRILPFVNLKNFSVTGIYYMPFLRKDPLNNKEKILKILNFKIILKKKNLKSVFILNDKKGIHLFNTYFETTKFKYLVDPVYSSTSVLENLPVKSDIKINFAFLGEISERKGIFKLLETISFLPDNIISKISFTIAGNASEKKDKIQQIINQLKTQKKVFFKTVTLNRIDDHSFENLLAEADVVFALHQMLEGSSGIIGKAALFKKPLIGPKDGLIGELMKKYNIGLQINTTDVDDIQQAIINFSDLSVKIDTQNFNKYVKERGVNSFINNLLK